MIDEGVADGAAVGFGKAENGAHGVAHAEASPVDGVDEAFLVHLREAGIARLYTRTGIARMRDALNPGGVLAVWSAAPDHKFTRRLMDAGLEVDVRTVRARPNNMGPQHTIWFAGRR